MNSLSTYKENLISSAYTCIIGNEQKIIFTSERKGVAPLMDFYKICKEEPQEYINLFLADKVIGKGAIFLAVLIGIDEIYTPVISEHALELAKRHSIKVEYETLVPYIVNRTKDGMCPIESSVINISDCLEAYEAITNKISELMKK